MTTYNRVGDKIDYPSSVKKYTLNQLANAFFTLVKDPKISRIIIPDIQKMSQDAKKLYTWKIDNRYRFLPEIGDASDAIIRLYLHSKSTLNVSLNNPKKNEETTALLKELENQKSILTNTIDVEKKNGSNDKLNKMIEELNIKNAMISKIKSNEKTEDNSNQFTSEKMMAIAKNVFDILVSDTDRADKLYEEFTFITQPKVDKLKESMGGDYMLQNSDRDRRYKSANGNTSNIINQRNTSTSNGNGRKYIPKLDDENENMADTMNKKGLYVPPHYTSNDRNNRHNKNDRYNRSEMNDSGIYKIPQYDNRQYEKHDNYDGQNSYDRQNSYVYQSFVYNRQNRDEDKYKFTSIDVLNKTSMNVDSFEQFPSLDKKVDKVIMNDKLYNKNVEKKTTTKATLQVSNDKNMFNVLDDWEEDDQNDQSNHKKDDDHKKIANQTKTNKTLSFSSVVKTSNVVNNDDSHMQTTTDTSKNMVTLTNKYDKKKEEQMQKSIILQENINMKNKHKAWCNDDNDNDDNDNDNDCDAWND
jgi:hypothetical protein